MYITKASYACQLPKIILLTEIFSIYISTD